MPHHRPRMPLTRKLPDISRSALMSYACDPRQGNVEGNGALCFSIAGVSVRTFTRTLQHEMCHSLYRFVGINSFIVRVICKLCVVPCQKTCSTTPVSDTTNFHIPPAHMQACLQFVLSATKMNFRGVFFISKWTPCVVFLGQGVLCETLH